MSPNETPEIAMSAPKGSNAHVTPEDPTQAAAGESGAPLAPAPPATLAAPRWPRALARPFWNRDERRLRALWRVIALAFVASLLSNALKLSFRAAGVPRQDFDSPLRTLVTLMIVLASVALAARLFERRSLADFGLRIDRASLADLAFGSGLGVLLMTSIFAVEHWAGWTTTSFALAAGASPAALATDLGVLLVLFVTVAINEELLFRGYLLRTLAEGLRAGPVGARGALALSLALTSGLFGVSHLLNPNATWVSALNITGAGVLLAAGYVLTGRLGVSIGLHLTWNYFQGAVYGFPVSGMQTARKTLVVLQQGGPELWTGGAFGPEAGLIGVLAIGLGLLLVLAWVRWRERGLRLCLALADPPAPGTRAA